MRLHGTAAKTSKIAADRDIRADKRLTILLAKRFGLQIWNAFTQNYLTNEGLMV